MLAYPENSLIGSYIPPFDAHRILVVRYRFIGDTILTVPFLRNLRQAFPEARIDVLVGPQSGQVLVGCPYINELIEFDTTRFHKYDSGYADKRHFLHYALHLRKRRYDTVFVLKRSLSSAILAFLSGAKNRIGYGTSNRNLLLTRKVAWNKNIHEVDSTLTVLQCAGVPIRDRYLESWISEEEVSELHASVPELSQIAKPILIHAAAAHPDKLYPLDFWARIARTLSSMWGCTPVFSGAPLDFPLYEDLHRLAQVPCLNLAGRLSLRQSMALYKQMKLAICVDSGPAHLSAATGTPTIALFGPTDPVRWRPLGEKHLALYDDQLICRPCNYKKTCSNRECLTEFDPQRVIDKAVELLVQSEAIEPPILAHPV
jgi:heptosyltransferase-2